MGPGARTAQRPDAGGHDRSAELAEPDHPRPGPAAGRLYHEQGHGGALLLRGPGGICDGRLFPHGGLSLSPGQGRPGYGPGAAGFSWGGQNGGSGGLRRLFKGGVAAVRGGVLHPAGRLCPHPAALRPASGIRPGGAGLYPHRGGGDGDGPLGGG